MPVGKLSPSMDADNFSLKLYLPAKMKHVFSVQEQAGIVSQKLL